MTVPANDGCPWPIDPGCLSDDWDTLYDEPTKARATALAGNTLRRLTGFRVGGCPVTVRPCSPTSAYRLGWMYPASTLGAGGFIPYMGLDGLWYNACGCTSSCGHTVSNTVKLTPPVNSVTSVKVDGAALVANTDYWVSGRDLIAISPRTWPLTQDLTKPDTASGTFSVTYLNSYPVDGEGAWAAGLLAMEYAKACTTGKCALPATVSQVVRQGVTYTLPAGSFPNGETGIREVDAYIALWNPSHRRQGPRVWAP